MNKLVEDLKERSAKYAANELPRKGEMASDAEMALRVNLALNKIVELAIDECLAVINNSDDNCVDEWDYAERDLQKLIKEHFGIE